LAADLSAGASAANEAEPKAASSVAITKATAHFFIKLFCSLVFSR
jgi:hypothetical protein